MSLFLFLYTWKRCKKASVKTIVMMNEKHGQIRTAGKAIHDTACGSGKK